MRGGAAIGVPGNSESAGIAACSARSQPNNTPSSNISGGSARVLIGATVPGQGGAQAPALQWCSCAVPGQSLGSEPARRQARQSALAQPLSTSRCMRRHVLPPARRSVWLPSAAKIALRPNGPTRIPARRGKPGRLLPATLAASAAGRRSGLNSGRASTAVTQSSVRFVAGWGVVRNRCRSARLRRCHVVGSAHY